MDRITCFYRIAEISFEHRQLGLSLILTTIRLTQSLWPL